MYKKRNAIILSAVLFLSTTAACGSFTLMQAKGNENRGNFSEMEATPLSGIEITDIKKVVTEDASTLEVSYTLAPADARNCTFNYMLTWDREFNFNYEENFSYEQEVEPYVSYVVNESKHKITFTCHQPFGRRLIFTMASQENANVWSQISIDYVRKLLSNGSAKIDNPTIEDGKTVKIDKIYPTYSIGSKGAKTIYNYAATTTYTGTGDYTWDKLFSTQPFVSFSGYYQTETVKYQGETINTTALLPAVRNNVLTYLTSIPTMKNNVLFSLNQLKTLCTFQKEVGFANNWVNDSNLFTEFVRKYKAGYENGHGLTVAVTYNDEQVYTQRLALGFDSSSLSEINFSKTEIEF